MSHRGRDFFHTWLPIFTFQPHQNGGAFFCVRTTTNGGTVSKAKGRTRRVGPITAKLLPIPGEVRRTNRIYDLYEMGEDGGWKRGKLPDAFWDELWDLLGRYGGIDGDGDFR